MEAGLAEGWSDFLVAEVGAAAALAGLLFVAVSINLTRILAFANLPTRAGEALVALLAVLVICTLGLTPGQSGFALGLEFAGVGIGVWLIQTVSLIRTFKEDRKYGVYAIRVFLNQTPSLPFVVAGVMIVMGYPEGAYWLTPGVLLSYAAGLYGAWVLLVEIQR